MCPMTFFADSAGATGGAVPFQRMIDPSKLGMFLNLEQMELLRLQRYRQHWRFYYGKHWDFAREDGDPLITFNYFKKIVDKGAAFLVSRGFNIKVPESLSEHTAPFLREVWKKNRGDQLVWDMAIMGGVTGDCFILVTYEEPSPLARRIFPFSQGKIVLNLLGSEQVFPDFNPLNRTEMRSVRIETLFYDASPATNIGKDDRSSAGRQLNIRRYTQIITPTTITEHLQGEEPRTRENVLGEIPLVHIKNLPAPNEPYGLPDCLEIIDVQRELNEKATDVSDVVNYNAAPITVITGAKAKQLERGPRQIWSGLPEKAQVYNLKLEGDLGAAKEYIDMVKEVMMELSDTPEGSLGKQQPISNTAGVALHMQYGPLMEKTYKKRAQYEPGIERVNYFVLRIGHVLGMINLPFDIDKRSGGKIALVKTKDGASRLSRAYHMDPTTFDFLDPMDMKLKFVREYSFGKEIREEPFWRILAEHRGVSRSFWDAEPETTIDDRAEQKLGEENAQRAENEKAAPVGKEGAKAKVARKIAATAEPGKLPSSQIEIPPEPERAVIIQQSYDAKTGSLVSETENARDLVPVSTELARVEYLNPYDNQIHFNDPLPKDTHLQAQLYQLYREMGIVSRRWVQEHISEVAPYISEIQEQLDSEATETPAVPPGEETPTEMQSNELGREAKSFRSPSGKESKGETGLEEKGMNTGRE